MNQECNGPGVDKLYAYADGRLDPAEAEQLEAHLASCAACRFDLSLARQVLADLSAMGHLTPVGIDRRRIREAVLARIGEAPAPQPRRWLRPAGLVAVGAAAAVAVFALLVGLSGEPEDGATAPAPSVATAPTVEPGAPAVEPGPVRRPAPRQLAGGERVLLAADAPARPLVLGERTGLLLQPGSEVVALQAGDADTVLQLVAGSALFKVAFRGRDQVFRVETAEADIQVVGTVFMVSRPPGEGTLVRVAEGRVQVRPRQPDAAAVTLAPGEELRIRLDQPAPLSRPEARQDPALEAFAAGTLFGARQVARPAAAATVAAAPADDTPTPADAPALAVDAPATEPRRAVRERRRHRPGRRVALRTKDSPAARVLPALPREEFVAAIAEARALARRGEHDRAVQHLARLTSRAPDGKLEAESRYLLARSYSALGSFSRALSEYDAVIGQARKGPVDQRALYEAGLLHSAELRRPRAAVELWERYLERYKGGLFEEEVSYLLCETRARIGDHAVALTHCRDYLDRFPRGYRSTEALFLTATLYRERRKDFDRALGYYEKYLGRTNAHRPDEALYWKAGCLLQRHQKGAAAAALRQYLERFPDGRRRGEARHLLEELGDF